MPPIVKAGRRRRRGTLVVVDDGDRGALPAPSAPQRACRSSTVNVSAGSTCGVLAQRDLTRRGDVSPSPKRTVVVVVPEVAARRCAVPACAVTVALALPRDPPVRVTSTIGERSDSFAVKPASLSRSTPAPREAPARAASPAAAPSAGGSLKRGRRAA